MITKIEKGLVNDDFIHDRVTLKVYTDDGNYLSCKLYGDGRLTSFWGAFEDVQEREIKPKELEDEIRAKL